MELVKVENATTIIELLPAEALKCQSMGYRSWLLVHTSSESRDEASVRRILGPPPPNVRKTYLNRLFGVSFFLVTLSSWM